MEINTNVRRHARRPSAGVELHQLTQRLCLSIGVLQHPEQVLEQHHLTGYGDRLPISAGAPSTDELAEERALHDVGGNEVSPPRLAHVDRVEVLGGGVVVGWSCGGGGYGAGVGAAKLEGLHLLEDGLDLGEFSSFGHFWRSVEEGRGDCI